MGRYYQTEQKKSGLLLILTLIVVVIAAAAAGWIYLQEDSIDGVRKTESKTLPLPSPDRLSTESGTQPMLSAATETEVAGDAGETSPEEAADLPELAASDRFVREELLKLVPDLSPWLDDDQLLRKFMQIANDFSQGTRLERHMRFLKPAEPFGIVENESGTFMAESGFRRFDALATAIDAMDVDAALAFYRKIRPLLLRIYDEFSYPDGYRLEDIFLKAGAEILGAPVRTGALALVRPSVHYKFADPTLEALSPVHKQMLRLGPENTRRIQNKVRKLVEALAESTE
ncbi:MAG: DUF3014 domain-containing protein [Gammaproteobacteria bacterium]